jgi:hypothetical protein
VEKNKFLKRTIVSCFIAVPILSSVISTLHLIDLFELGNPSWLALALAVAIEIGSVASFLTLSILSRINKTIVWAMFFLLFFMQIVGNMYFSYEWITNQMAVKASWIDSFKQMTEFFTGELEPTDVKMYLTILISWPIPLISVFLLKSAVDYIGSDKKSLEKKEAAEKVTLKEPDPEEKVPSFLDMRADEREKFRSKFQDDPAK